MFEISLLNKFSKYCLQVYTKWIIFFIFIFCKIQKQLMLNRFNTIILIFLDADKSRRIY